MVLEQYLTVSLSDFKQAGLFKPGKREKALFEWKRGGGLRKYNRRNGRHRGGGVPAVGVPVVLQRRGTRGTGRNVVLA